VGHTGTDGKPFSSDEIERLQRALVALELSCLSVAPGRLNFALLLEWHGQLSAGIPHMQPGQWRTVEITFGSNFGAPPDRIITDLGRMLDVHQQTLTAWEESAPSRLSVLEYATQLHADLIDIHPFWDGNGRLARLVQAWLCWSYGLPAPRYVDRPRYLAGLNRYMHTGSLGLLMEVTVAALPDPSE
jgi:fido (protein-threonine AMPylation protein)